MRDGTSKQDTAFAQIVPGNARPIALIAVKAFHSLAFGVIQTAIFYLLYQGLKRESDMHVSIAFTVATGEIIIYAGNGFHCPLTKLAEKLGAESGSVTDIFLPKWLAANVARIYVPLFALGLALHARNLRRRRQPLIPPPA